MSLFNADYYDIETGNLLAKGNPAAETLLPLFVPGACEAARAALLCLPNPNEALFKPRAVEIPVYRRSDLLGIPFHPAFDEKEPAKAVVCDLSLAMLLKHAGFPCDIFVPDTSPLGTFYDKADEMVLGVTRLIHFQAGEEQMSYNDFLPWHLVASRLRKDIPAKYKARKRVLAAAAHKPFAYEPAFAFDGSLIPGLGGVLNLTGRFVRFCDVGNPDTLLGELPPHNIGLPPLFRAKTDFVGFLRYQGAHVPVVKQTNWLPSPLIANLMAKPELQPPLLVPDEMAAFLVGRYSAPVFSLGPELALRNPAVPSFVCTACLFQWQ